MKDIADRYPDPRALQNAWVSGGGGRGGRGGRGGAPGEIGPRTVTVSVKLPSGETIDGRMVRIDDFMVTVVYPTEHFALSGGMGMRLRWKSTIRWRHIASC